MLRGGRRAVLLLVTKCAVSVIPPPWPAAPIQTQAGLKKKKKRTLRVLPPSLVCTRVLIKPRNSAVAVRNDVMIRYITIEGLQHDQEAGLASVVCTVTSNWNRRSR